MEDMGMNHTGLFPYFLPPSEELHKKCIQKGREKMGRKITAHRRVIYLTICLITLKLGRNLVAKVFASLALEYI